MRESPRTDELRSVGRPGRVERPSQAAQKPHSNHHPSPPLRDAREASARPRARRATSRSVIPAGLPRLAITQTDALHQRAIHHPRHRAAAPAATPHATNTEPQTHPNSTPDPPDTNAIIFEQDPSTPRRPPIMIQADPSTPPRPPTYTQNLSSSSRRRQINTDPLASHPRCASRQRRSTRAPPPVCKPTTPILSDRAQHPHFCENSLHPPQAPPSTEDDQRRSDPTPPRPQPTSPNNSAPPPPPQSRPVNLCRTRGPRSPSSIIF